MREYGELGSNFRLLSDIRFKLLAFLPIAAAASLKGDAMGAGAPLLSLFGLIVTLALASYNARNDQLYDELVGRAASIERHLGLPDGQFANRPRAWLALLIGPWSWKVDHRSPVTLIYAASCGMWLFGVLAPTFDVVWRTLPRLVHAGVAPTASLPNSQVIAALTAIIIVLLGVKVLRQQEQRQARTMRRDAAAAVSAALGLTMVDLARNEALLERCATLAAASRETVAARARFYGQLSSDSLDHYVLEGSPPAVAAQCIALLTDLPAGWLFDCVTDRRGVAAHTEGSASAARPPP